MRTKEILVPALMTMLLAGGVGYSVDAMAARDDNMAPAPKDGEHKPAPAGPCGKLTPEQRAAVDKIMEESDKRMQPLRDQMYVKKHELKALLRATNPDVAAVGKKAEEITKLRQQIHAERAAMGEQLDKALGLEPGTHKRMQPRHRHGFGPGPGHGGPGGPHGPCARPCGPCGPHGQQPRGDAI